MTKLKRLLATMASLFVVVFVGNAHADELSYRYEATVLVDSAGLSAGDTISGTFSYDTAPALSFDLGDQAIYFETATLTSDQLTLLGDSAAGNLTIMPDGPLEFMVEDLSALYLYGDVLEGTEIPLSLNLGNVDYSNSRVTLYSTTGAVVASISSITALGAASSVPELSAKGTATSLALIAGAAFILSNRREYGEISQS